MFDREFTQFRDCIPCLSFFLLFLGNTCIVVLAETYVKLVRINKYAFRVARRLF